MKTVFYFLTVLVICFSFSGCAIKGEFNNDFISKEINPYFNKVEGKEIHLNVNENFISKTPESMTGKLSSVNMNTGEINKKISEKFFKQYFTKVDFNTNCSKDFCVKSNIKDYSYSYARMGHSSNVKITLEIEVLNNGKSILKKVYEKEFTDKVIYNAFIVHASENLIELFHRSLLELYENEFKKDFIEALKSNK